MQPSEEPPIDWRNKDNFTRPLNGGWLQKPLPHGVPQGPDDPPMEVWERGRVRVMVGMITRDPGPSGPQVPPGTALLTVGVRVSDHPQAPTMPPSRRVARAVLRDFGARRRSVLTAKNVMGTETLMVLPKGAPLPEGMPIFRTEGVADEG